MSFSHPEPEEALVPATQVLAWTQEQLVRYLQGRKRGADMNLSNLAGVMELSRSQKEQLAQKTW